MVHRRLAVAAAGLTAALIASPVVGQQAAATGPKQDPVLLRFAERVAPWYPGSLFTIKKDDRKITPSGSYRVVEVDRACDNTFLAGAGTFLYDETSDTIWVGAVARMPLEGAGMSGDAMHNFLASFLPDALRDSMRLKVRVDWDPGPNPTGALIPFTLQVDTGYGESPRAAAVTSDGALLLIGNGFPIDQDPVAWRRELLASDPHVVWDHEPTGDGPVIELVEFSDLECPACRGKWPLIEKAIERFPGAIRHGMVSFPLTSIHPWAFRAASASWCVAAQQPTALLPFKELFYDLQPDMEVSLVTDTARDFLAGHELDEETFNGCYLRKPSLDAVHAQLGLGTRLGVQSTPTYFVNGWQIQVPEEGWLFDLLSQLSKGEEP